MMPPKKKRILFKDPGQEMGNALEALFNDLKNQAVRRWTWVVARPTGRLCSKPL